MTNAELNRDIKRLAGKIKTGILDPYSQRAKDEFTRLYGADNELKHMNKESVIILLILNRKFHYVNFKDFGPADL
jgi:hypothetical protein